MSVFWGYPSVCLCVRIKNQRIYSVKRFSNYWIHVLIWAKIVISSTVFEGYVLYFPQPHTYSTGYTRVNLHSGPFAQTDTRYFNIECIGYREYELHCIRAFRICLICFYLGNSWTLSSMMTNDCNCIRISLVGLRFWYIPFVLQFDFCIANRDLFSSVKMFSLVKTFKHFLKFYVIICIVC